MKVEEKGSVSQAVHGLSLGQQAGLRGPITVGEKKKSFRVHAGMSQPSSSPCSMPPKRQTSNGRPSEPGSIVLTGLGKLIPRRATRNFSSSESDSGFDVRAPRAEMRHRPGLVEGDDVESDERGGRQQAGNQFPMRPHPTQNRAEHLAATSLQILRTSLLWLGAGLSAILIERKVGRR